MFKFVPLTVSELWNELYISEAAITKNIVFRFVFLEYSGQYIYNVLVNVILLFTYNFT